MKIMVSSIFHLLFKKRSKNCYVFFSIKFRLVKTLTILHFRFDRLKYRFFCLAGLMVLFLRDKSVYNHPIDYSGFMPDDNRAGVKIKGIVKSITGSTAKISGI